MQSCMDDGGKKYRKQNFVLLIHVVVIPLYKVCNSCYYWLLGMDIVAECRSGYATITTRIPKLQGCQRPDLPFLLCLLTLHNSPIHTLQYAGGRGGGGGGGIHQNIKHYYQ